MTFLKYKAANEDRLLKQWQDTGKPGTFEMFCFNEYKAYMTGDDEC